MKVILIDDVEKLGKLGEVVDVREMLEGVPA